MWKGDSTMLNCTTGKHKLCGVAPNENYSKQATELGFRGL